MGVIKGRFSFLVISCSFALLFSIVIVQTRQFSLAHKTVDNIHLEWQPNSLAYHNDPPTFEYNVTLFIVNPGPLSASLSNSTFTIYLEGEQIAINPLENDILLRVDDVYEVETEDSSVTVLDPNGGYKRKLNDMNLNYRILLNSELSCGPLKIFLTKTWSHNLGFMHTSLPGP